MDLILSFQGVDQKGHPYQGDQIKIGLIMSQTERFGARKETVMS